jgi:ATP-dependent Clp protease adaptor protein ClpS
MCRMSEKTSPETTTEEVATLEPLYNLILFNDDDHTYEYVIFMLGDLFGIGILRAKKIAYEVDYLGESVVKTCPREEAVAGRNAIQRYGPDPFLQKSHASMRAAIQPAPGG